MKKFLSWLFWPRTKTIELSKLPFIFFILSNLLPIFGVLFLDWKYFPILFFYCIEAFVGGSLNFVKIVIEDKNPPRWFEMLFVLVLETLFVLIPMITMIAVAASRINNAVESVSNPYFVISAVILILTLFIPWLKELLIYQNNKKKHIFQKKPAVGTIFYFKPLLFVGCIFFIVITNFYTAALMILVVVKTFIDLRSFFRRLPSTEGSKSWLMAR